jgi:hypothetical protein
MTSLGQEGENNLEGPGGFFLVKVIAFLDSTLTRALSHTQGVPERGAQCFIPSPPGSLWVGGMG